MRRADSPERGSVAHRGRDRDERSPQGPPLLGSVLHPPLAHRPSDGRLERSRCRPATPRRNGLHPAPHEFAVSRAFRHGMSEVPAQAILGLGPCFASSVTARACSGAHARDCKRPSPAASAASIAWPRSRSTVRFSEIVLPLARPVDHLGEPHLGGGPPCEAQVLERKIPSESMARDRGLPGARTRGALISAGLISPPGRSGRKRRPASLLHPREGAIPGPKLPLQHRKQTRDHGRVVRRARAATTEARRGDRPPSASRGGDGCRPRPRRAHGSRAQSEGRAHRARNEGSTRVVGRRRRDPPSPRGGQGPDPRGPLTL